MQLGQQLGLKLWEPEIYRCLNTNTNGCDWNGIADMLKRIGGYGGNTLSGGINVYGPRFLSMYAQEFGGLSAASIDGLGQFLAFMRTDKNLTDIRHAAYMLATVYHETGNPPEKRWTPVDEADKGVSKSYGKPSSVQCGGKTYTHIPGMAAVMFN